MCPKPENMTAEQWKERQNRRYEAFVALYTRAREIAERDGLGMIDALDKAEEELRAQHKVTHVNMTITVE